MMADEAEASQTVGQSDTVPAANVEEALRKAQRAVRAMREVHRAFARATDESQFLSEVCRIIVEVAGYRLAWIGFAEQDERRSVRPVAQHGYEEGYLKSVEITWDDTAQGGGPTGTAIRMGKPWVASDILTDPSFRPWRDEAIRRGYASSSAVPLIAEGETLGALNLYAAEADAFNAEEVELLAELAGCIAQSIAVLRMRKDRQREKEALADSEAKFGVLFQLASDAVFLMERDRFVDCNSRTLELYGCTREQILGHTPFDFSPPKQPDGRCSAERALEKIDAALAGTPQFFEWKHRRLDGSLFDVEVSLSRAEIGDQWHVLAVVRDITERKQAERELRQSEERHRGLIESLHEGVWVIDENACTTFVNPRMAEMLGYTAEEMLGRHQFSFMDERGKEVAEQKLDYRQRGIKEQHEFEFVRKDGSRLCVLLATSPLADEDGNYAGAVAGVLDVTERKQAERKLLASRERLRVMVEGTEDGLWDWDVASGAITFNEGWIKLLGYESGEREFDFEWWDASVHPDSKPVFERAWSDYLQGRAEFYELEYRLKDTRGEWHWIWARGVCVQYDDDGNPLKVLGTHRDITERKQAEDALRKVQQLLSQTQAVTKVGGWEYDVGTRRITWTDEVYRIHGLDPSAYDPNDIDRDIAFYAAEDQAKIAEAFQRAVELGEPYDLELRFVNADGQLLWVRTMGQAECTDGKVVRVFGNIMDITPRKRAELALSESEERFRRALENIPDVVVIYDPDLRIQHINAAARRITGRPTSDFIGKRDDEIWPPEAYQVYLPTLQEAFDTREIRSIETDLSMPDGVFNLLITCVPLLDEKGEIREILGITHDYTERKQAEKGLIESERRYRALFENMTAGFVLYEVVQDDKGLPVDLVIIAANEGFWITTGLETQDVTGKRLTRVLPGIENDAADWIGTFGKVALTGEPRQFEQGSELLGYYYSIAAYQAAPRQCAVTFLDITERKRAEAALRESEARLRLSVAAADIGLWDWDLQTNTVHYSPEWKRQIGYRDDEISNDFNEWQGRVHPDDLEPALQKTQAFVAKPEGRHEAEFRFRHKDGSYRWIYTHADVVRDATGKPVRMLGCHIDITERKRNEQALQQMTETLEHRVQERTAELQEKNAELDAFAHSVSHDLRAPLRGIEGFSRALVEDYGPQLEGEGREYLDHIVGSAIDMDGLIKDLLEYSRIGRRELRLQAVGLEGVVAEAIERLQSTIDSSNAEIIVDGPLPSVRAHLVTLRQVVANLLSNGVKFAGADVRPRIRIWAEPREDMVRLWVEDNGIGIDEEHQTRIFQVFERLHGVERYPGTGIGLAIVQRATERMGGRCGVESTLGQGSRFWVEYPHYTGRHQLDGAT